MQSPLTHQTADRVESALAQAAESRLAHIASLEGNPLGIETRAWPTLRATMVRRPAFYYGYFNAVRNVRSGCEDELDEALAWFASHELACSAAISPFSADEQLLAHLAKRALQLERFMSVLFAELPLPAQATDPGIEVREDRGGFKNVWMQGAPDGDEEAFMRLVEAEFADWRCYTTSIGAQLAAMGALYVTGRVGVMASASTLSTFRGRGCQTALLQRRIADAAAAGCDLIVCQAAPGSQSQRNLERAGLRTAYTHAIWATA